MGFNLMDIGQWKRQEYYLHYIQNLRCTYSLTTNIDITALKHEMNKLNYKIYPALIYMITTAVNRQKEFRMEHDNDGRLGYWDEMSPSYTVFNKDNETFSSIWTGYDSSFPNFYNACMQDISTYSSSISIMPKPNMPRNTFNISSIPWTDFTAFNLNVYNEGIYLLPIFTIGKFIHQEDKILMPLAVQVHHAVCDGFHLGRFINNLHEVADNYMDWM